MKHILCTLALIMGFSTAQAQDIAPQIDMDTQAAPAWACSLSFHGEGRGLKLIVGRYVFNGKGRLNCTNVTGKRASYKVNISMRTALVSPGVSIGSFEMKGRSADVSLGNSTPQALLGDYYIAQGQGAIVRGAGVLTAVKVGTPQLALKISVQFLKGAGFNLAMNKMQISLAD